MTLLSLSFVSKIEKSEPGKDHIKATVLAYVEYFTAYSGVFMTESE